MAKKSKLPQVKRGRPAGISSQPTASASKTGPGRPKLPGVAKGTVKMLSTSIASVQKRLVALQKVIDQIKTN
jgi:hypothetical protein